MQWRVRWYALKAAVGRAIPRVIELRTFGFVVLSVTVAPGQYGLAQSPERGAIEGIVLRALDSLPLAAAKVSLDSSGLELKSDSNGAFRFAGLAFGSHVVHVMLLGYQPASAVVTVTGPRPAWVTLRLQSPAQVMPEVEVLGHQVLDLPRFTQAIQRANRNNGAVFTAAEIARENPLETKMLLERLPGVHVNDRGITFSRCQDSGMLPRPTYGGGGGASASFETSDTRRPRTQVYVDGLRLTRDEKGEDANQVLKTVNPRSIAVMEVYTGIARIPGEFSEDACAVVAIWTKAY